jgi:hypothetical protein
LEVPGPPEDDPAAGLLAATRELVARGEDPEDRLRRLLAGLEQHLRHQEAARDGGAGPTAAT